jgi:hemolysin III
MTATPSPSLREEVANAISHGLGLLLALASLPVLAAAGWLPARPGGVLGTSVFAVTMMLVFLSSTVYHALPPGRAKAWLQLADHAAIFLFIAGSFTPFALRNLDSAQGQLGFALVWVLALTGIVCKVCGRLQGALRSTLLYVALGWVAAAAALPTLEVLTAQRDRTDRRRRRGLHGGRAVLPAGPPPALQPLHLAPVRAGRQRLPLRGGAAAPGLTPRSPAGRLPSPATACPPGCCSSTWPGLRSTPRSTMAPATTLPADCLS